MLTTKAQRPELHELTDDVHDRNDTTNAHPESDIVDVGRWVTVRYRIFDSTREPVEDTARELRYLHGGFGAIFPKLEEALTGLRQGAQVSVTLQPEDAFGDYEAERITLIPSARLPEGSEIGMTFEGVPGEPTDGLVYTLTDLAQGQAVLDGNHPLAGMSLRYDLTIETVASATPEEIAHERLDAGR